MSCLDPVTLQSLATTAAVSAEYLDACDNGALEYRLDPVYYQACGELLLKIFQLVDAPRDFPALLARSPAAREIAETVSSSRKIKAGWPGFHL